MDHLELDPAFSLCFPQEREWQSRKVQRENPLCELAAGASVSPLAEENNRCSLFPELL